MDWVRSVYVCDSFLCLFDMKSVVTEFQNIFHVHCHFNKNDQVNHSRDSAASFNSFAQNCMLDSILEDREEECDVAQIVAASARNSGASSMDADELMHLLS